MDLGSAFGNIHWLSVVVAAISAFLIGGIWYGPVFGKAWLSTVNISEEELQNRSMPRVFGLSLLLSFIAAFFLDLFIGSSADLSFGAIAGFMAGIGWVSTMLGILYLFEILKSLFNQCNLLCRDANDYGDNIGRLVRHFVEIGHGRGLIEQHFISKF